MTEAPVAPPPANADKPTLDTAPAGEKAPADFMSDIVGDFEQMDKTGSSAPASKPKPEPSKPAAKVTKPSKPETKPAAEAKPSSEDAKPDDEAKTEEPATKPAEEVKPVKAAELRNAYENLKKKVKSEYEPEIQRLRAKVEESASKPADVEPLQAKIKTLEERNAQLEKHIEYVDYTQSEDFKTKYDNPYTEAYRNAVSQFLQLRVREREKTGENEVGEPVYQDKTRPATESDLLRLGAMNEGDMDEVAEREFGASAPRVIRHIEKLRELSGVRKHAIEEAQKKAGEWKQSQTAEFENKTKKLAGLWQDVTKSLEERLPKAFHPDEGDEVDKEAHTKGFALADLLFLGPQGLTDEQIDALPATWKDTARAKKPLSEEQQVKLHALARLKMANHDRQMVKLKKANERIAELEKTVADYEKSEPAADKAGASGEKSTSKDWLETAEDELKALDK